MAPPHGYHEVLHPPHGGSAAEASWRLLPDRAGGHRVLPDGRCDLILRFRTAGGRAYGPIVPVIAGAAVRAQVVPVEAGVGFVGVRLRPGTARAVLGLDPRAIRGRVLVGDEALEGMPALRKLLEPARDVDSLARRLDALVADRSPERPIEPLTARLLDALHAGGGRSPVARIGVRCGVDVRTVRRRVSAATGLTPKQMAAVIRFHRALRLRCRLGLDPASAAVEAGYADQAHMVREFRSIGGIGSAGLADLVLPGLPLRDVRFLQDAGNGSGAGSGP